MNPQFWAAFVPALAGLVVAITGLVKAFKANDKADTANALLELHQEDHAPSPTNDPASILSPTVTETPEKS